MANIRTLLLIDNDLSHADAFQAALREGSDGPFNSERVGTLAEGIERLREKDIWAIFVNLSLPDSQGIETYDRLLQAVPGVPTLVLGTAGDKNTAVEALRHGAKDYLLENHVDAYSFDRAIRNMAERETAEEAMAHQAQHDWLTNLPNRTLLMDRIGQAIETSRRNGTRLAVQFLDLDGFKHINDSLGHAIGDKVLQSVAKRLLGCVRTSDTVARMGGDEFVVVLSEVAHARDAGVKAKKILDALSAPHGLDQYSVSITASIGVTTYPNDGQDAEILVKNADLAMYRAKEKGPNNYQFFERGMNVRAMERQWIEASLRHALERDEFVLHYQPKINLKTGEITGVEALIRWQHPDRGLVLPLQFISVAEDCGLMLPIGRWVLRESCKQAQAWQDAGLRPIEMAVNVSSVEFRSEDFLEGVKTILKDTRLEPRYLELELTESVLMRHVEFTAPALQKLKAMGVRLAIDDFGTGYSSLSYLKQFPIDSLKVDQSFVREIAAETDDATIVNAVINMSRGLKHRVIAEGVETAEQVEFLQAHGCDEGQGYYFGRPVPAPEFAKLLETGISVTMQN